MSNSSTSEIPAKPGADVALFWHPRGGWCKKIKGRSVYFGRISASEALERYLDEIDQRGRGFDSFEHSFQTIGDEAKDPSSVKHIMAHVGDFMSAVYREGVSDERLLAVTNTVRDWLFSSQEGGEA